MLKKLKLFRFIAVNAAQKKIEGYLFACHASEVYFFLSKQNLTLVSVQEASHIWYFLKSCLFWFSSIYHITPKMQAFFYRYLGELLQAGFPPSEAIFYLLKNTRCIPLKKITYILWVRINQGHKLSQAFAELPESFISRRDLSLITASENLPHIEQLFLSIADEKEERIKTRFAVVSSVYLLLGLIFVIFFASHHVAVNTIPHLINDGRLNNYELTATMQLYNLVFGLEFLNILIILSLTAVIVFFLSKIFKKVYMRFLPYFREIIRIGEVYSFFSAFALGLRNHLTLQEAFLIAGQALGKDYFRKNALKIYERIIQGVRFEDAVTNSNLLNSEEQQLINLSIASRQAEEAAASIRDYARMKMIFYTKLSTNLIQISLVALLLAIVVLNIAFFLEVYFITKG
ncbi:MAG: ral secretion pathway protein GspF [Gammaproteobacteria bacterium]|jgi:type II secretory pathway component PulF|nr:ral secretion pathway protein GspF [Gammaproteobacteria bacterium]